MRKKIISLIEKLTFRPLVGGLEINDSAVRFLRFEGKKITTAFLRLPPGVILDGKISDRQNFSAVLKTIRSQLVKPGKGQKIQVIVSLPASVVFSQSFNIPEINQEGLAEAAELNLQMISPISWEGAYSDWQIIGANANQKEILGVFAERKMVDEYDRCLHENGFLPVAFEFPALALNRLLRDLGPTLDQTKPYLIVNITTDGLNFLIIKNSELYFNHFLFWRTLQGEKKQITIPDFKNILIQETQKVVNFGLTNLKEPFGGAVIIASALESEAGGIIREEFGLEIIPLRLRRYSDFQAAWFVVLGSALRGLIPRRQDTLISLTGHNVVEEFYHEQTLSFIALWRNIFIVSFLTLLMTFGLTDVFFLQIKKNVDNQLNSLMLEPQTKEVVQLQDKAKNFNQLVNLIAAAKQSGRKWSSFFEQLNNLAGNQIIFDRIFIQSLTSPVKIQGRAENEQAVINFKNELANQANFEQVNLPITGIQPTADRRVSFELFFVIKSLTR
jgi:Tfp pilus assembly protein PilN